MTLGLAHMNVLRRLFVSSSEKFMKVLMINRTNIKQGLLPFGVFINLIKAFETVDHDILLDKLNHYGFRGIINDWFSSHLKNRTHQRN